jgi:hypothetical protein
MTVDVKALVMMADVVMVEVMVVIIVAGGRCRRIRRTLRRKLAS